MLFETNTRQRDFFIPMVCYHSGYFLSVNNFFPTCRRNMKNKLLEIRTLLYRERVPMWPLNRTPGWLSLKVLWLTNRRTFNHQYAYTYWWNIHLVTSNVKFYWIHYFHCRFQTIWVKWKLRIQVLHVYKLMRFSSSEIMWLN